ncbi:MAG: AtpZ/AtpI family protein [Planctomycetota bacterium]|nr:AtpZ/AtpI family protein [Planctomycetota bacterium]
MPDPHDPDQNEATPKETPEHPDDPAMDDPRLRIPEVLRARPGDLKDPDSPWQASESRQNRRQSARSGMAETARAWGMALDLVFTAVGAFVLGYLFDLWRGTGPWGALVGLGLGFVTATVRMIQTALKQEAREKAQRREKRP